MKNKSSKDKKIFYFFIACISLSIIIIGATFAYFSASINDNATVMGESATSSIGLRVSKVTSLDLTFGLVPMKNNQAPYAAEQLCYDDYGSVGCQIYKITVTTNSDESIFVDGFITTDVIEGIETRFTRVYPKQMTNTNEETGETTTDNIFTTNYTKEDMLSPTFDESKYIKTGNVNITDNRTLNKNDDYDALFVENEQIGGDAGDSIDFYLMIWIWDDNKNQDFIQGNRLVYTGTVTFVTAQGNEIKATFD